MSTFAELGVPGDIVSALDRQNITEPFAIQSAAIPDLLARRDVLGRAPTGSGKTLAFGLPLVAKLKPADPKRPKALVLAPTRELAAQIRDDLQPFAEQRSRSILAVFGGVGVGPQIKALHRGVDALVATPGRLIDLLNQGEVKLDAAKYVVIDEADRMADMGFLPDVKRILDRTPSDRQTVLFSATLGKEVQVLVDRYQSNPITHEVGSAEPDLTTMEHRFVSTERPMKVPLAAHFIAENGATIVFCRTRHGADRVARQLKREGIRTGVIHGNRSQNQRQAALAAFSRGKVDALVATDVAARGIHVDAVGCVIHFDPPDEPSAYVHRSGRTARAGASGVVVSFVNADQVRDMRKLQKSVGISAELEKAPKVDSKAAEERARTMAKEQSDEDRRPRQRSKHGKRPQNKRGPNNRRNGSSKKGSGKKNSSKHGSTNKSSNGKPGSKQGSSNKASKSKPRANGKPGSRPKKRQGSSNGQHSQKRRPKRQSGRR